MPHCQSLWRTFQPRSVSWFTCVSVPETAPKFRSLPVSWAHSPLRSKFMMSQSMILLSRRGSPTGNVRSFQLRDATRTMRAAGLLLVYSLSFVAESR
jgi:hypothetical protein